MVRGNLAKHGGNQRPPVGCWETLPRPTADEVSVNRARTRRIGGKLWGHSAVLTPKAPFAIQPHL